MRSTVLALLLSTTSLFAQQTATIRGRVVDQDNGNQPVANATVDYSNLRGVSLETKTAADGTYSIDVAPGRWFVEAADATRVEMWAHTKCLGANRVLCGQWGDPIDVAAGETRNGIDFSLSTNVPFGTIKGTITGATGVRFIDLATGLVWRSRPAQSGNYSYTLPPRNYLVLSNDGSTLHGLSDGRTCIDPCPWMKSPNVNLTDGATVTVNIQHPAFGITSLEPDNGRAAGGTPFTIKGLWYSDAIPMNVMFGSAAAPLTQQTFTAATGIAPAGSGTTTVTATSKFSRTLTLTDGYHSFLAGQPFLALTAPNAPVRVGNDATVVMTLDPPRGTDTIVSLGNSNPELLSVPTTVTIPANHDSVTFLAHPLGYGGGRITASAPGAAPSSAIVQVVAPKISVSVPTFVMQGTDPIVSVTIDPPQSTDTPVIAWGVDVLFDEIFTIPANQASASFPIHDLPAHFQIFLPESLGGTYAEGRYLTGYPTLNALTSDAMEYALVIGEQRVVHLHLLVPRTTDTTVTFTVQGDALSVSPSTLTIPAASNDATFTIKGLKNDQAVIYAKSDGIPDAAFQVYVYVPPPASRRHAK